MANLTPAEHQHRIALVQQGLSDVSAAKQIGINTTTFREWRQRNKLKPNSAYKGTAKRVDCAAEEPPTAEELAEYKRRLREFVGLEVTQCIRNT